MELEPPYCEVFRQHYDQFTGKKAERGVVSRVPENLSRTITDYHIEVGHAPPRP